jgi:hypothetical protein
MMPALYQAQTVQLDGSGIVGSIVLDVGMVGPLMHGVLKALLF